LHDTVWFEIQGTPAVTIASDVFQDAATTQAEALGLRDAKRCFVKHPIQDRNDAEMAALADGIVEQVMAALLAAD